MLAAALVPREASAADCLRDGDTVVKRTGLVTVLSTGEDQHVACMRTNGRRTELDFPEDDVTLEPEHRIRISGHFVSYVTETTYPAGADSDFALEVADALRMKTWTVTGAQNCSPAEDWVINGRGSVAWIAERECHEGRFEVWRCLQRTCDDDAVERLDRGRGIAPRSLRRRGDRVTWVRSGVRRSASFR